MLQTLIVVLLFCLAAPSLLMSYIPKDDLISVMSRAENNNIGDILKSHDNSTIINSLMSKLILVVFLCCIVAASVHTSYVPFNNLIRAEVLNKNIDLVEVPVTRTKRGILGASVLNFFLKAVLDAVLYVVGVINDWIASLMGLNSRHLIGKRSVPDDEEPGIITAASDMALTMGIGLQRFAGNNLNLLLNVKKEAEKVKKATEKTYQSNQTWI